METHSPPNPEVSEIKPEKPLAAHGATSADAALGHPFISRIEIDNFRNFHKFAVDLAPTSVIVGENKVGKSNLLEAIRLVLDPTVSDAARKLRAEDFWDGLGQPFAGHKIAVRVFIRDLDKNVAAMAVLCDCIVEKAPLTARLTYEYRSKKPLDSSDSEEQKRLVAELDEDDYDFVVFGGTNEGNRVGSEVRKWLTLVLLPALRDAEGDIQSWRRSPLRPLLERIKKTIPAKHFSEVRRSLDEAKATLLKAQPVADLVSSLNRRVRDLAGPINAVETDLDFASSEPEQLVRSLRVFLKERSSKPLSDVSLGTANILFLALLLQDMEMKQAAKEIVSIILAIEEPEAHLHPQLQRLLFRYFLGRNQSILLTTHSPNIASVAPIGSIILLRVANAETQGFNSAGLSLTPEQTDDLQRYLDVTRAEMLFARGVIFVEGLAEQFLVPAFAAVQMRKKGVGVSLDDLGISVCSVNGTDFAPFRKLLSNTGFAIPNVVITDGDPAYSEAKGKTLRKGLYRGCGLLRGQAGFEELKALIDADNEPALSAALTAHGIFVGERTLELDMLENFSAEVKATYSELRNSDKASKAFDTAADAAGTDAEQAADVLARIEAIGKGRFAQRLAGKLNDKNPPSYIQQAIDSIIGYVTPTDAEPKRSV